jgi:hypothetical protein
MATYPGTLPSPLLGGYQANPQDQVVRTQMEVGTARARLRSTAQIDRVTVQWLFTDAQMATFRTWYYQSSASGGAATGTSWFTISLPIGQTGLTTVTARFLQPYTAQGGPGLLWQVHGELEVRYA